MKVCDSCVGVTAMRNMLPPLLSVAMKLSTGEDTKNVIFLLLNAILVLCWAGIVCAATAETITVHIVFLSN